jgi:hypothetical protein
MERARLVEDRERETCDLLRVFGKVVAPLGQLDGTAAPDVRDAIDLRDLLLVAPDVVDDEPFTQRQVAERDVLGVQAAKDRVDEHGTRHHEVRAARVEAGHSETLLEIEVGHILPQPANLFCRHAQVAQLRRWRTAGRR